MGDETREAPLMHAPVERETVMFYGRPIVAVRLDNGRVAVLMRWLCEGMGLHPQAQVRRIQRTESLAQELVYVWMETEGSAVHDMPALMLEVPPGWLAGIDTKRVSPEMHDTVLSYQREAYAVLYDHFARKRLGPPPLYRDNRQEVVPAEPAMRPMQPVPEASRSEWIAYYQAMITWLQWQEDTDQWRGAVDEWRAEVGEWRDSVESRLESVEEVSRLVPEILERLGAPRRSLPNISTRSSLASSACTS